MRLFCVESAGGAKVVRRSSHLPRRVQPLLPRVAAAFELVTPPSRSQSRRRSEPSLPALRIQPGRLSPDVRADDP